jgi:hypothetical protein
VSIPVNFSPSARVRRAAKLLILVIMTMGLLSVAPAEASNYFGVAPGFPTTLPVGGTSDAAYLHLVNHGPAPVEVTDIEFLASCSNFDITCAGGITDPTAITYSATGTGSYRSGCSNRTFNLQMVNRVTGLIRLIPSDGQPVILTQHDIASDYDVCRITFSMTVNRVPNHDARPDMIGYQTYQNIYVAGMSNGVKLDQIQHDIFTITTPFRKPVPTNDFNGDGRSDVALFGDHGNWIVANQATAYFGLKGDQPVAADYDGDGDVDRAVFREGTWYVQGRPVTYYGLKGDLPVPADYDGDGDVDKGVYRNGTWFVENHPIKYLGLEGDIPVPADYNGDGDAERAVYRNGAWYVEGMVTVNFGLAGDIPVPGDYDGDGDAERAVYRNGAWYIEGMPTVFLGLAGDVPVPGDYAGDGKVEPAVFRNGTWFRQGMSPIQLGTSSDTVLGLPQAVYTGFFG